MTENPNILLINSDASLLTVLSYNLERYGFIVNAAKHSSEALSATEHSEPNLVIIDDAIDSLPENKTPAIELCKILKSKSQHKELNIILLTSNPNKYQNSDSEQYFANILTKPFAPSELVSRIKSLFTQVRPISTNRYLEYKDLKMNVGAYKVTRNGRNIHLGPTEFKILQCLMEFPNKILTREHIMKHVWGYNSQVELRTIDVHINRLRAALKNDNKRDDAPVIKTIRSSGYCLSIAN